MAAKYPPENLLPSPLPVKIVLELGRRLNIWTLRGLSSCVFGLAQFVIRALKGLRTPPVLPQCCPARFEMR